MPASRRLYAPLFFVLVAAVLLFSDKGHVSGDGEVRFRSLVSLVEDRHLSTEMYTLVQPLLASPLYAAGALEAAASGPGPGSPRERRIEAARRWVGRFNKVAAFLICLVAFATARRVFSFGEQEAALATLGVLFASLLVPNARDFYSECLWTLLVLAVLLLVCREAPPRAGALALVALLSALAVPLDPLLVAALGAVFAALLLRPALHPRARALALAGFAGLALGIGLFFLENLVRRGAPLDAGYGRAGFTAPFLTGFGGQLIAPARGIVFFLPCWLLGPVLAAAFRRRLAPAERRFVDLSLIFSVVLVLGYSKWFAWHGATYWGPRFLLPLSVLGVLYLALLVRRGGASPALRGAAFLLAFDSFLIRKVGVAIGQGPLADCLERAADTEGCYWAWRFSPPASLLSRSGRLLMLGDRSTAVELGALALFALLAWAAARRRSAEPAVDSGA